MAGQVNDDSVASVYAWNDLVSWFVGGYQSKWIAKQVAIEKSHNKRTTSLGVSGKYWTSIFSRCKRLKLKWYHQKELVKASKVIKFTKTKLFSLYRRFLWLRAVRGVSCTRYKLTLEDTEVYIQFLDFPNYLGLSVLMNQIYCVIMLVLRRILRLSFLIIAEFHFLSHYIVSLLSLSAANQSHWK